MKGTKDKDMKTYNIHFNDSNDSNDKGFKSTLAYCELWINNNKTTDTYFRDYKGGEVSIVCNETGETVYSEEIWKLTKLFAEKPGM